MANVSDTAIHTVNTKSESSELRPTLDRILRNNPLPPRSKRHQANPKEI